MSGDTRCIALIGYSGPLAQRTADLLRQSGKTVVTVKPGQSSQLAETSIGTAILFPFPPPSRRTSTTEVQTDISTLETTLKQLAETGKLTRVVLRSRATAYGNSFKNYGLMDEERPTLLDPSDFEHRWIQAEEAVTRIAATLPQIRPAILRFTNIAHRGEGDFLTRAFLGKVVVPAAGHDPRVQFITLDDAAKALALAVGTEAIGVFNISGDGCVDLRRSLRAVVPLRIPVPYTVQKAARSILNRAGVVENPEAAADDLRYNWTVTADRAKSELGFRPAATSVEALRELLKGARRRGAEKIPADVDDFGLDEKYLDALSLWFKFLCKVYWRAEIEGMENVPRSGAAILTANHRGFMPFDGVVHRTSIKEATGRQVRFLVIPSLFKFPFLSDFLIKQGGVVASQLNTARLFQRGELVGIFPEGINGAFRMYKGAYQLGNMGRDAFAKMAIEHQVPIIPATVVGHVEIFPILGKMNISSLVRFTGWPFIPITPTFPLLPAPLPTKWHLRYLEPVSVAPLTPEDANDRRKVRAFSEHIKAIMQKSIDEMLLRRKHIFFGKIFDGKPGSGNRPTAAGN